MVEIQVESESGNWYRVDEPYTDPNVAVADATHLADKYSAHGHIRVITV